MFFSHLSPLSPHVSDLSPHFAGTTFLNGDSNLQAFSDLSPLSPQNLNNTPKECRKFF